MTTANSSSIRLMRVFLYTLLKEGQSSLYDVAGINKLRAVVCYPV